MSSHRKTAREIHGEHEDARNALAALRRLEDHARQGARLRVVAPLVQQPEAHYFHECPVVPISPRRAWGWPDAPGSLDSTGFSEGGGIV